MKSFNRFLKNPHSFYLILPFLVLWCISSMLVNRAAMTVGTGIAAVGFSAAVIKDFYDVQRGDFLRRLYKATPNHGELLPYKAQQIQEDKRLQSVQKIILAIILLHILAAFLGTVAWDMAARVALMTALLLPLCAAAVYGICGRFMTLTEAQDDFADSGFGRIFGRKRVSLGLYFVLATLFLFDRWALGNGGTTLLCRGRYFLMVGLFSVIIAAWFFGRSDECRHAKPLAVSVAAVSVIYALLFVDAGNLLFDFSKPTLQECRVIDTNEQDYRYSVNIHHEDYLIVENENGQQMILHMPYNSFPIDEINSVTVALHDGAFGIQWAEITMTSY